MRTCGCFLESSLHPRSRGTAAPRSSPRTALHLPEGPAALRVGPSSPSRGCSWPGLWPRSPCVHRAGLLPRSAFAPDLSASLLCPSPDLGACWASLTARVPSLLPLQGACLPSLTGRSSPPVPWQASSSVPSRGPSQLPCRPLPRLWDCLPGSPARLEPASCRPSALPPDCSWTCPVPLGALPSPRPQLPGLHLRSAPIPGPGPVRLWVAVLWPCPVGGVLSSRASDNCFLSVPSAVHPTCCPSVPTAAALASLLGH